MPYWPRTSLITLGIITIAAIGAAGCEAQDESTPQPTETPRALPTSVITETHAEIFLIAPEGDFQEGWAYLTDTPEGLKVELDVSPGASSAQPAHIHLGGCDQLGDILHSLENVIGGTSESVFEGVTLADVANGDTAINIHRSFADFPTYTACGEIPPLP